MKELDEAKGTEEIVNDSLYLRLKFSIHKKNYCKNYPVHPRRQSLPRCLKCKVDVIVNRCLFLESLSPTYQRTYNLVHMLKPSESKAHG